MHNINKTTSKSVRGEKTKKGKDINRFKHPPTSTER